jgi:transporter family-2 protein
MTSHPPAARVTAWGLIGLAFVVSAANSVQARVNGAASEAIDHPIVAAMMSVGGGFIVSTAFLVSLPGARRALGRLFSTGTRRSLRTWHYFAGFGGGIFIFGQALVVPQVGVSVYMIAVVTGQTLGSLWVDHIGLGPAGKKRVTLLRFLAGVLAVFGVIVSAIGRGDTASLALAGVVYGLGAGVATSVQYALNGRIGQAVSSALVTSSLNFSMGFSLLTVFLFIDWLALGRTPAMPPSLIEDPHLWLGGPLGMLFIASATLFVRYLGVLVFAVISVLGQLAGALALDVLFPTEGTVVSALLLVGLLIVSIGVVLASLGIPQNTGDRV